jgi:DeoR family suf operon transcriptional repressor
MASTRELVLETLLNKQRCTINELAEAVGINPISVRHHVTKLEAADLVTSEEERHGVGRPRRLYFLTEVGMEQFPTRYLRLTTRLLAQLKEHLPDSTVDDLFAKVAEGLISDYSKDMKIEDKSMEERLEIMTDLLKKEGFTIDWEKNDDGYQIRESSCPYFHIGQAHPEVCILDQALISNVLSVPVEKVECVLHGDSCCKYQVSASKEN